MAEEPPRESGAIKYVCVHVCIYVTHCICFVTLKMSGNCIFILLKLLTNILSPPKGLLESPNLNLSEHLTNTSDFSM